MANKIERNCSKMIWVTPETHLELKKRSASSLTTMNKILEELLDDSRR